MPCRIILNILNMKERVTVLKSIITEVFGSLTVRGQLTYPSIYFVRDGRS